jgi:carbon starvation protein
LAPANSLEIMSRVIFNDYLDATLAGLFVLVVLATVVSSFINARKALGSPKSTTAEVEIGGAAVGSGHA